MFGSKINLNCFIHSKAFNSKYKSGFTISPINIVPDHHHGKDFIEFLFYADCYEKYKNDLIILSKNWLENINNIENAINESAKKLAGMK